MSVNISHGVSVRKPMMSVKKINAQKKMKIIKMNIIGLAIAFGIAGYVLFVVSEFDRRELVVEVRTASEKSYIEGYLTGAYQCLKSDSLILRFAGTYDLTPSQQEDCIDILDMSRAVHQQIDMFFPDIKDYLNSL